MKRIFVIMAVVVVSMLAMCSCSDSGRERPNMIIAEEGNIRINGLMKVDAANRDKVIDLSKQLINASLGDEGVIDLDIMESVTNPNKLMFFLTWKDQATFDKHRESVHFRTLIPQLREICQFEGKDFVVRNVEEIDHEKPFRFNVVMTAKNRDRYIHVVKEVIDNTMKNDAGVIEYDLFSSLLNPERLLLLEVWENRVALVGHLNSSFFTKARKRTKGLIDDTQYIARMQEDRGVSSSDNIINDISN